MPTTMPVLFYYLDPNGEAQPLQVSADGLPVRILDRSDAQQACQQGTTNALGDNIVLATPGSGWQYIVAKLAVHNESTTATTVIVKFGSREVWRIYLAATAGDGKVLDFPAPDRLEGRDNQPLILNLSDDNSVGYSVQYYRVEV